MLKSNIIDKHITAKKVTSLSTILRPYPKLDTPVSNTYYKLTRVSHRHFKLALIILHALILIHAQHLGYSESKLVRV